MYREELNPTVSANEYDNQWSSGWPLHTRIPLNPQHISLCKRPRDVPTSILLLLLLHFFKKHFMSFFFFLKYPTMNLYRVFKPQHEDFLRPNR